MLLALLCVQAVRHTHSAQGALTGGLVPVRWGLILTTLLLALQVVLGARSAPTMRCWYAPPSPPARAAGGPPWTLRRVPDLAQAGHVARR